MPPVDMSVARRNVAVCDPHVIRVSVATVRRHPPRSTGVRPTPPPAWPIPAPAQPGRNHPCPSRGRSIGPNIRRSRWRRPLAAAAIFVGFIGVAGAGTTHAAPLTDDGWTTDVEVPATVARGDVVTLKVDVTAATHRGGAGRSRGVQPQQQRQGMGTGRAASSGTPQAFPAGETQTLDGAVDGARRRADQRPLGQGRRVQAGLGRPLPLERFGGRRSGVGGRRRPRRPPSRRRRPADHGTADDATRPRRRPSTPTTTTPATTTTVDADDDHGPGDDDDRQRRRRPRRSRPPPRRAARPATAGRQGGTLFSESFTDPSAFGAPVRSRLVG